jgi:hypothetical protein
MPPKSSKPRSSRASSARTSTSRARARRATLAREIILDVGAEFLANKTVAELKIWMIENGIEIPKKSVKADLLQLCETFLKNKNKKTPPPAKKIEQKFEKEKSPPPAPAPRRSTFAGVRQSFGGFDDAPVGKSPERPPPKEVFEKVRSKSPDSPKIKPTLLEPLRRQPLTENLNKISEPGTHGGPAVSGESSDVSVKLIIKRPEFLDGKPAPKITPKKSPKIEKIEIPKTTVVSSEPVNLKIWKIFQK